MQSGCPHRLPLQGYIQRVIGEDRFRVIIALIQANTLASL